MPATTTDADAPQAQIPLDTLARVYLKIKAAREELTKKYDAENAALEQQSDEVKNAMKSQMQTMGVRSVNTPQGTIVMGEKRRFFTQDWDAFKKFVIDNDVVDLLEKRIAQGNMATFLENNPGAVPPGLNSLAEVTISVRKPTK